MPYFLLTYDRVTSLKKKNLLYQLHFHFKEMVKWSTFKSYSTLNWIKLLLHIKNYIAVIKQNDFFFNFFFCLDRFSSFSNHLEKTFFLLQSRLDVYLAHFPDYTSVKTLLHWGQVGTLTLWWLQPMVFNLWIFESLNMIFYNDPSFTLETWTKPIKDILKLLHWSVPKVTDASCCFRLAKAGPPRYLLQSWVSTLWMFSLLQYVGWALASTNLDTRTVLGNLTWPLQLSFLSGGADPGHLLLAWSWLFALAFQTAKTGDFKQFDYREKNQEKYNQVSGICRRRSLAWGWLTGMRVASSSGWCVQSTPGPHLIALLGSELWITGVFPPRPPHPSTG